MFIIAGLYRRQSLVSPKGNQTRPSANRLREALFNICQHKIGGARFLDLFAGSGAMGLEALSREAQFATFIDSHKEAIRCIERNIEHLKVQDQCQVVKGEAFAILQLLERQGKTFDIIFVDPPYRTLAPHSSFFYSAEIIRWIDSHSLLNEEGLLFVEEDFDSQPQIQDLKTLQFIDGRRIGQAALQQYIKTTHSEFQKKD